MEKTFAGTEDTEKLDSTLMACSGMNIAETLCTLIFCDFGDILQECIWFMADCQFSFFVFSSNWLLYVGSYWRHFTHISDYVYWHYLQMA